MEKSPLERAVDIAGGQTALANKIGTTQPLVFFWLTKAKKGVAAEYCLAIENATGVPRHELRPDIFQPPAAAPAPAAEPAVS